VLEKGGEDQCDRSCEKEELSLGTKVERNVILNIETKKFFFLYCHILRRNCVLRHVIGGKIVEKTQGMGR